MRGSSHAGCRPALPDEIRAACARVAGAARHVRIEDAAIAPYARDAARGVARRRPTCPSARPAQRAAFVLQLDAVNFGSGWFPTLRKPPGSPGFRTVEARPLRARAVERRGAGGGRRRRGAALFGAGPRRTS